MTKPTVRDLVANAAQILTLAAEGNPNRGVFLTKSEYADVTARLKEALEMLDTESKP